MKQTRPEKPLNDNTPVKENIEKERQWKNTCEKEQKEAKKRNKMETNKCNLRKKRIEVIGNDIWIVDHDKRRSWIWLGMQNWTMFAWIGMWKGLSMHLEGMIFLIWIVWMLPIVWEKSFSNRRSSITMEYLYLLSLFGERVKGEVIGC